MSVLLMGILIVKPGSIGNVVQALPAFAVTRKAMPRTEISRIGDPGSVKFFRDNPLLDRLIEVVTKALGRGLVSGETLRAPRQQLRQLRASAFDFRINFKLLLKSPSIARPSGALRILGFLPNSLRDRISRFLLPISFPGSINPYTIRKNLSHVHVAAGIPVIQDVYDFEFPSPTGLTTRAARRTVEGHSTEAADRPAGVIGPVIA